jgi:hypothetical protein
LTGQRASATALARAGWLASVVAGVIACSPLALRAQETRSPSSTPGWIHLDTDLLVTRDMLETRWAAYGMRNSMSGDYRLPTANLSTSWTMVRMGGMGVELFTPEFGRVDSPVFVRPQFALASASPALRDALRAAGFEAHRCMAPVMRLRGSLTGGANSAGVTLLARCSLN